ncbi:MAG TPA: hypothetical protein VL475_07340 [Planctomycetaceae bacterium]|nr:hypothetical protein [Planctomycetaceae bacterium]
MSQTTNDPDLAENPLARPPLGLPTGSVRAVLALLIVAVVIVETVRGRHIDELWSETLLIALAHYFTSRRFVGMSADLVARLEREGALPQESNPLYLPRHSIRALIVLAFAGLGWYVFQVQQVRTFADVPPILITVSAYLLGIFARGLFGRRLGRPKGQPSRLWEDLKALAVILVLLATAIPYLLDHGGQVPPQLRSFTLAFVLFYFGSR